MKNTKLKAQAVLALSIQLAFAGTALANPTGAQVVAGQVGFAQPNAATLAITNSPGAIINWQGFSIGPGEVTRYLQQSASSAVLNRVIGADPSRLYGTLQSNGSVFLINPHGVVIGPGGVIDTAGFVASSLNVSDTDWLAGKLRLRGDADSGAVANQGWIRTGYGGRVALIAPHVENGGLIETPGGGILLAAGQAATLASVSDPAVQFEVQAPADTALNVGRLLADGGAVQVLAGTIMHSGEIRANSLVRDEAGSIVLRAVADVALAAGSRTAANGRSGGSVSIESLEGTARVAGNVSARAVAGRGGRIEVLGGRVALTDGAALDASGAAEGGVLRVGGDVHGANPQVRNAASAFVGAGATLRADATGSGDGGSIVVWSDGDTRYLGTLSAKGGPDGGNGGFAEVSGKADLLFVGGADLRAPRGTAGTLLLDPLDLFIDSHGGINPLVIDEDTDFPNHAVTVSPATLAAIGAHVILFASRDVRFNSAVTLTGAGQGLAASAGRDLELAAGITTSAGAVSLTALGTYVNAAGVTEGGHLTTYASSPIATSGGAVTLTAKDISAWSMSIDAGSGAVAANASAGSVALGSIASSGSIDLTSTGGSSIDTGNLASTGPVTLTSNSGPIETGSITAGGNTKLTAATWIKTSGIATGGGTLAIEAKDGSVYVGSTIDTRSGGGPSGGAVTMTAKDSYAYYSKASIDTRAIFAGDASVSLSGESISTGGQAIDTTGNVTLTAATTDTYGSAGIEARVDHAAAVDANATIDVNSYYSARVDLTSGTALNASNVTATATKCWSTSSCPSASVTLNAVGDVNVGTVSASASRTHSNEASYGAAYDDPKFENLNESVYIASSGGWIRGQSAASLVTAADVTLATGQGTGGGVVGTSPLKVDVERSFTFRPNGQFDVELTGTGPNRLTMEIGAAASGASYTGTLAKSGQIALDVSATDTTVTVNHFNVSSGFDQRVYNTSPSISLGVPNAALDATTVSVPKGDQTGTAAPSSRYYCSVYGGYHCPPSVTIEPLPVTLWARDDLSISAASYTRVAGTQAKSTSIYSNDGSVTLGTVDAGLDSVSVSANTGVTVTNSLTTGGYTYLSTDTGDVTIAGSVTSDGGIQITNYGGNVLINSVNGGTGDVTINAYGASSVVGAIADNAALEITTGGGVSIHAHTIGSDTIAASPAANPLDVVANSVSLQTFGSGSNIGFAGRPIIANTTNLTIDASANFNADTGPVDLTNLTVTASPSGVGAAGLAQVGSNGVVYAFASDGTHFTLGPYAAPAEQFAGGLLSFTSTSGNLTLAGIDFSVSGGSFAVRANGAAANVTQNVADAIDLGTGTLRINADGAVNLEQVNAGGMNVSYSNYPGGCFYSSGYRCGVASFTANQTLTDTALGGGTWSVDSRGAITAADLEVGGVSFSTESGDITTGAIGTSLMPAASVNLSTQYPSGGSIQTGAIEADNVSMSSYVSASGISVLGTINAVDTGASSITLQTGGSGALRIVDNLIELNPQPVNASSVALYANTMRVGDINASAPSPGSIGLYANSSITAGSLDAGSITGGRYCCPSPSISLGAIGANKPGNSVNLSGSVIAIGAIGGSVALDPASSGSVSISSGSTIDLGGGSGSISAGDGSSIHVSAGSGAIATPFQFATIDAGASGDVRITAPAGIRQTLASASGGGITGSSVNLSATSAGSAIEGPAAPLTIRGATELTLDTAGSVNIELAGIGAGTTPELGMLYITRRDSAAAWSLTGFAAGQSVGVTNLATGAGLSASNTTDTPLAFTYLNADSIKPDITGSGIATRGGSVWLDSYNGVLTTGAIDTSKTTVDGTTGAPITLIGQTGVDVSDAVDASTSYVSLRADNGSVMGLGTVTGGSVSVTATNGDIGNVVGSLAIVSPTVDLTATRTGTSGGNVFAVLTGTTSLTMQADNGSSVVSDTALTNVDFATRGTGTGTLDLAAPGQVYTFARPAADVFGAAITNTFQVVSVAGATPPESATFRAVDGDLLVAGPGTIAVPDLTLRADSGTLKLQGTSTDRLNLANTSQAFSAGQDVLIEGDVTLSADRQSISASRDLAITGKATLAATGSQYLSASRDLSVQAQSGSVVLDSSGSQTLYANGDIMLAGGAAADETVTVNALGSQTIETYYWGSGDILFQAGGADRTSVSVTGSGSQNIKAGGNLTLQAGAAGTSDATVEVYGSGGSQYLYANGTIAINAGDGTGAFASVRSISGTQTVGDSYNYYGRQTDTVRLQGGGGAGSYALIEAAGTQKVEADNYVDVLAGSGADAYARITKSGSGEQRIGFYRPDCYYYCYNSTLDNVNVKGSTGTGSYASIDSDGVQRVSPTSSLNVWGGDGGGAFGRIHATSTQYVGNSYDGYASTAITGGAGTGAVAQIASAANQIIDLGNTSLAAGSGHGSDALLSAGTTQTLNVGNLALQGGGTSGGTTAVAKVSAPEAQNVNASAISLVGGAGPDSYAAIESTTSSQEFNYGSLALTGGTDTGTFVSINAATTQSFDGGNINVTGGSGAGSGASITGGSQVLSSWGSISLTGGSGAGSGASITGGSQVLSSWGSISLTGGTGASGESSDATIGNLSGDQVVTASGSLSLRSGPDYGGAYLRNDLGGGTQTVSAGSGILLDTDVGAATASSPVLIDNAPATMQMVNSASGGITVSGLAAEASIVSAGDQTFSSRWIDVHTHGTASASITSPGDQWIHTTNGTSSATGSLRVAALGTGIASIEASGNQLLEIDYPELMKVTGDSHTSRDGRITIGDAAAQGTSRIKAVDQDIFARSITIQGGSGAGSLSKLEASGTQNVSTLVGGIDVTGGSGAGSVASLDPATQTVVANGTVGVAGGSAADAVAAIAATGTQIILTTSGSVALTGGSGTDSTASIVTTGTDQTVFGAVDVTLTGGSGFGAAADISSGGGQLVVASTGDLALTGGSGDYASAMVFTSGPTQAVGAGGDILLTPGTGLDADALFVSGGFAGTGATIFGCGTGACAVSGLLASPFLSGTSDAGIFRAPTASPSPSPLADILGLAFPAVETVPFAPDALGELLVLYDDRYAGFAGEGDGTTTDEEIRIRGRLKQCR